VAGSFSQRPFRRGPGRELVGAVEEKCRLYQLCHFSSKRLEDNWQNGLLSSTKHRLFWKARVIPLYKLVEASAVAESLRLSALSRTGQLMQYTCIDSGAANVVYVYRYSIDSESYTHSTHTHTPRSLISSMQCGRVYCVYCM